MSNWIKCTERMPELDDDGYSDIVLAVEPKKIIFQNFTVDDKWKLLIGCHYQSYQRNIYDYY